MAHVISNLGGRPARTSFVTEGLIALFNRVQEWSERRRTRNHLYRMPDYILQDIGISRAEVETEWQKPFWQG